MHKLLGKLSGMSTNTTLLVLRSATRPSSWSQQPPWLLPRARRWPRSSRPRSSSSATSASPGGASRSRPKAFLEELSALDADAITVRVNSFGGSVSDGLAIYNALKRHPAQVTTVNEGAAMSIASLILMAGDVVEMGENTLLMIHAPWTYAGGNSVDLRATADMLDKWAQAMATSYASKTGRPVDEMLAWLTDGQDHYFTAAEAQAEKLIDNVVAAVPVAAMAMAGDAAARYRAMAAAKAAANAKPAAPAAPSLEIQTMPQASTPAGTPSSPANEEAIRAKALADESAAAPPSWRLSSPSSLKTVCRPLMDQCANDTGITVQAANERLLAHLGSKSTLLAGNYVTTVEDEADKRRKAATQALAARAGLEKLEAANPHRGDTLYDMAALRWPAPASAPMAWTRWAWWLLPSPTAPATSPACWPTSPTSRCSRALTKPTRPSSCGRCAAS